MEGYKNTTLRLLVPLPAGQTEKTSFVDLDQLGDPSTGARIRSLRKLAGLTQDEVADRSGGELTQTDVSRLETQPHKAPLRHFLQVASILKSCIHDILEDDGLERQDSISPPDASVE